MPSWSAAAPSRELRSIAIILLLISVDSAWPAVSVVAEIGFASTVVIGVIVSFK